MKVDTYKTADGEVFVAVPAGTAVPDEVAKQFGVKELFKSALDISDGQPRVGMDPKQVAKDIQEKGHAVFGASIGFKEKPVGKPG